MKARTFQKIVNQIMISIISLLLFQNIKMVLLMNASEDFTTMQNNASKKNTGLSRLRAPEQELITGLLKNYNKMGRPILDTNRNITLTIYFYLSQITDLDERSQIFVTRGWLYLKWKDEILKWNETETGIKYVNVMPEHIWTPDIALGNSAQDVFDKSYKEIRAILKPDGEVEWYPGGVFKTYCNISIFYYPFDDQRCSIVLQQWASFEKTVYWKPGDESVMLEEYQPNGMWNIESTVVWRHADCYPLGEVVQLYHDIYLRRKSNFVVINILLPCILISLLALLVFYLVPDSGEKITLGVTTVLAYTIFLLLVGEIVPKTSDEVPLITIYLTTLLILATISVAFSITVLRVHHHDVHTSTGPCFNAIYKFVSKVIAPKILSKAIIDANDPEAENYCLMKYSNNHFNDCNNINSTDVRFNRYNFKQSPFMQTSSENYFDDQTTPSLPASPYQIKSGLPFWGSKKGLNRIAPLATASSLDDSLYDQNDNHFNSNMRSGGRTCGCGGDGHRNSDISLSESPGYNLRNDIRMTARSYGYPKKRKLKTKKFISPTLFLNNNRRKSMATRIKNHREEERLKFRFLAVVCDKLLLIIFLILNLVATLVILVIIPMEKASKAEIMYIPVHKLQKNRSLTMEDMIDTLHNINRSC